MQEIFELEIWSRPGMSLDIEAGKELESIISNSLNLDAGIVLGLSFVPDKSHVDNLLIAVNEKELFVDKFTVFCNTHNMRTSLHDMKSAAYYLEYVYGRPLAWLHIPHNEFGLIVYKKIFKWCNYHDYNIQDGNNLYCITPALGRDIPIGWSKTTIDV